jgi:hypothetical protein
MAMLWLYYGYIMAMLWLYYGYIMAENPEISYNLADLLL